MAILIVIFLIAVFVIIIFTASNTNDSKKSQAKNSEIRTIDLDVPNPIKNPEGFLDFIEKTDATYLWQIESQLDYTNNLQNIILRKALNDKSATGKFDKLHYLKILSKAKENTYSESELTENLDQKLEFVTSFKIAGTFISNRKENLIFNIDEGSIVILERDPYNKFDENAIVIRHDKSIIGYVPRNETNEISEIIKYNHIAKIADIIYIDDYIDVIVNIYQSSELNDNPQYYLSNATILELRSKKIDSKFLRPKKDADDVNAFYKKKVVISGDFDFFVDRNDLAQILYDFGADIDCQVTEKVSYLIAGKNSGWKKLEKAEEFGVLVLNESEIKKILSIS